MKGHKSDELIKMCKILGLDPDKVAHINFSGSSESCWVEMNVVVRFPVGEPYPFIAAVPNG